MKRAIVLALCGVSAACATTPATEVAQKKKSCVTETEEATGSRVQSYTVCKDEKAVAPTQ